MKLNSNRVRIIQTSKSKVFPWTNYETAQDDFNNYFSTKQYFLKEGIFNDVKSKSCKNFLIRFDKYFFVLLQDAEIIDEISEIDGFKYSGYIKFDEVKFIEPIEVSKIEPIIPNIKAGKRFNNQFTQYYIEDLEQLLEIVKN